MVKPSMTYFESMIINISVKFGVCWRAYSTAISSSIWLSEMCCIDELKPPNKQQQQDKEKEEDEEIDKKTSY